MTSKLEQVLAQTIDSIDAMLEKLPANDSTAFAVWNIIRGDTVNTALLAVFHDESEVRNQCRQQVNAAPVDWLVWVDKN